MHSDLPRRTNSELKDFKLIRAGAERFDDFYALLCASFIKEELRGRLDARATLDNPSFLLYNIQVKGESIGYISVWRLDGFAFIEHFAVKEEMRGMGYGEETIRALCREYGALVLECEPRVTEIQKRRAAFYERCGFVENAVSYLQPSYGEGLCEVPLLLMSYPTILSSPSDAIKEIYKKVYRKTV